MKEVVEQIIGYWEAQKTAGASASYHFVIDLTVFCLRQYMKYLTGGKRE